MNRFFANTITATLMVGTITTGVLATNSVASAEVLPAEQQEFIDAHNDVRRATAAAESARLGRQVTIPDLVWSPEAAQVAQDWADRLGATNTFDHNQSRDGFGENLAAGQDTPRGVVQRWASEVTDYDYDSNSCTPGEACGHYTQVVWAETTAVGCGIADHPDWGLVQVCNYVGHGNVTGQRPYEPGATITAPPVTPPVTPPATPPVDVPVAATFDSFAAPVELGSAMTGGVVGDNIGSTLEQGEAPLAGVGGNSVHYRIVAPVDGYLGVSTVHSDYDTVLGIGTGTSVTDLVLLDDNDDNGDDLSSLAVIPVTAGQTYQIMVGGYDGAEGTHNLGWSFIAT